MTLKGALAWVGALMFGEEGAADEGLPAVSTFIGPHSRVSHLVAIKLRPLAKGFPTLVTVEGLLRGVNPLVLSEVFAVAKGFLTFVTLKALPADHQMFFLFWVLTQGLSTLVNPLFFSGVNALVASEG